MKHDLKVTILLVLFFLAAQYVGLFITSQYVKVEQIVDVDGNKSYNVTEVKDLPLSMERMDVSGFGLILYLSLGILIGTAIVLILVKFRKPKVWKVWYFISLVFVITFALKPFIGSTPAFVISLILAYFKTYRSNLIIHNLSEIFLYGGFAGFLVPIHGFTVFWAFVLLIVISIYDAIAVWKSKHMVALAKFQSDSNVFAGLFVPYQSSGKTSRILMKAPEVIDEKAVEGKSKTAHAGPAAHSRHAHDKKTQQVSRAILGGGDIAFPLLFTGVVMKSAGYYSFIIPPIVAISLFLLLYYSKKGRFYPAMPFITLGCIAGYLAVIGLQMLL